jgi:CO/xanthine dehydrogenase Mo-binding subunit
MHKILLSHQLGLDEADIRMAHSDTDLASDGGGTYASRTADITGVDSYPFCAHPHAGADPLPARTGPDLASLIAPSEHRAGLLLPARLQVT